MGQFTNYSINAIITKFLYFIFIFFSSILTARVLGPQGKGELALILLIPYFVATFGRMGIGHSVNFYASKTSPTKLVINSFILMFFLGMLLLALSLPSVFYVKDIFFKEIGMKPLIIISFFVPFYMFYDLFGSIIQSLYKINERNFLTLAHSFSYLFLLIIFIIILKAGVSGAVTAWIISILAAISIAIFFLFKEIKVQEISLDLKLVKELLFFGSRAHIGNILKNLSYRADILIVSYFLDAASVGYYIIAVSFAEIIWGIPDAISSVLLPRIARMDRNEAISFTSAVCRRIFFPLFFLCVLLVFFSRIFIPYIYGTAYLPSIPALNLLIPGILSLSVWKLLATDMIGQGHPGKYSLTSALALISMIICDILLIPRFGINGAAAASSISYITATLFILFFYLRINKNSMRELFVPEESDFHYFKCVIGDIKNSTKLAWSRFKI